MMIGFVILFWERAATKQKSETSKKAGMNRSNHMPANRSRLYFRAKILVRLKPIHVSSSDGPQSPSSSSFAAAAAENVME
jgi:hypothetical protein